MARITLSSGFTPLAEGTYDFEITGIDYQEAFGKMKVTFETETGKKHTEFYNLLKSDGSTNDGALAAFSIMAKNAFGDNALSDIDPAELIGKFIKGEINHQEYNGRIYAHVGNFAPSDGFGQPINPEAEASASDLASLLG